MTNHLLHSRKYFTAVLCLLFFAVSLLTFPIQTIAQTRSGQRERRVQIFFAYNPTRPAAGQEVQFQDFSRGNPTSWLWDFGDGQTSILQNPRHAFTTPGSYKVNLTARNNISSGRVSRTLNVILSISASFTYGPSYPTTGQAVQFTDTSTGGPTSWQWNFGDGATSTSQNPSHTYTTAASYTVTLTVAFSSGSKTVSQTITVTPALVASFTYSPSSPVAGQAVQFMDTSTGSPTSWQWSFGDGATSNSQNPSHTYATAASYTVTLTVVYSSGSKSISQTITVLPPPALTASFTYSPSSPVAGQAVQFTETSTGNPTSWLWNFGDNTTSTSKNPSHTYATGSYTVTLTVTNSSVSKSVSQTITVSPASTLNASFTYSPSSPAAGQAVQFTDTSTGSPTSWQWSFGDSATSTSQNASHSYAAGSYTVTLTVTNSSASKSVSQTITVSPASTLNASFTYSPSSPVAGQVVYFTDTSTGSPTSWQWNFGDNTTSNAKNPSHSYSVAANYTVALTVTNSSSSKSASQTITVAAAFAASFTYSPSSPVAGQVLYFTDTSTGSPTSWQWNFGDSTSSTSKNPSHAYTTTASYTVTLTVTNSSGSKSASQTVTVVPALTASFNYGPTSPAQGQAVQFMDTSTGSPTSWQWNFGDNATSTLQNPTHTYTATGSYWVNLIITKGTDSQSTSQMISVRTPGTITAASPSYADVSTAISSASPGDTVIVPAGSASWSNQLIITKGIILKGAGMGNTVITSNYNWPYPAGPSRQDNFLIVYQPASPGANEPFRLTGFTFNFQHKCMGILLKNKTVTAVNKIRIDNNIIKNSSGQNIIIDGTVYGVIDSNQFILEDIPNGLGECGITFYGNNQMTWNNLIWTPGTADNMYVEDNTFMLDDTPHLGGAGGRYAIRYNTYNHLHPSLGCWPWFDAHGSMYSGGNLSMMGVEIYENVMNAGSKGVAIFDLRGGEGIIFNNRVNTTVSVDQRVTEELHDSLCPPALSPINGQPQHVSDSYIWNNTRNGTELIESTIVHTIDYGGDKGIVPRENIHFWDQGPTFDGTSGVGVGPIANRPTTCTKGVAYWATDRKILYRCTATNTWEEYYKPYTYPHPLRKELF